MHKNRTVIMVNGKKRAGKDYFSDLLIDKKFTKLSVARGLKDIASKIANIGLEEMDYLKNEGKTFKVNIEDFSSAFLNELKIMSKRYNISDSIAKSIDDFKVESLPIYDEDRNYDILTIDARLFLQHMNIFKIIFEDDDIWIKMTATDIENTTGDIVIADFRFPNEFEVLDNIFNSVTTVKVIGKNYYETDEYDNHISETALNNFQFNYHINNTIWNDASLNAQVVGLLKELGDKNDT